MKINVPFYKQTTNLDCGPVALKMVFDYFGKDFSIAKISKLVGLKEGKGISTIELAIVAVNLGFNTRIISKSISFNKENLKLDFYKKYIDKNLIQNYKKLLREAEERGVIIEEKTIVLKDLVSAIRKDSILIILLDWNAVVGEASKGYQGHFVPVVGYDDENVYVHNHGFQNTQAFFKIKKEIFDKARKAKGTGEDILIIQKQTEDYNNI